MKYRSINAIAQEINVDWSKQGKGVNYAARPYLDAMFQLSKISDKFFEDSGSSIVAYFLANAQSWRGDVAKRVKAELNAMLKGKAVPPFFDGHNAEYVEQIGNQDEELSQ